jgi:tetratricopeptide (TPR) repeat protein
MAGAKNTWFSIDQPEQFIEALFPTSLPSNIGEEISYAISQIDPEIFKGKRFSASDLNNDPGGINKAIRTERRISFKNLFTCIYFICGQYKISSFAAAPQERNSYDLFKLFTSLKISDLGSTKTIDRKLDLLNSFLRTLPKNDEFLHVDCQLIKSKKVISIHYKVDGSSNQKRVHKWKLEYRAKTKENFQIESPSTFIKLPSTRVKLFTIFLFISSSLILLFSVFNKTEKYTSTPTLTNERKIAKVIILPFHEYCLSKNENTQDIGRVIKDGLADLKRKDNLPILPIYLDDFKFENIAELSDSLAYFNIMKENEADLLIYGGIRNKCVIEDSVQYCVNHIALRTSFEDKMGHNNGPMSNLSRENFASGTLDDVYFGFLQEEIYDLIYYYALRVAYDQQDLTNIHKYSSTLLDSLESPSQLAYEARAFYHMVSMTNLKVALASVDSAISMIPEAFSYYIRGYILNGLNDSLGAIKSWHKAAEIERRENQSLMTFEYIDKLGQTGDFQEMVNYIDTIISRFEGDPMFTVFQLSRIKAYNSLGDYESSLRYALDIDIEKLSQDEVGKYQYYQILGSNYLELNKINESINAFSSAINTNLNQSAKSEAYLGRAICYLYQENFQKSLKDFNTNLTYGDSTSLAFYLRSEVKKNLGDEVGANIDLAFSFKLSLNDTSISNHLYPATIVK